MSLLNIASERGILRLFPEKDIPKIVHEKYEIFVFFRAFSWTLSFTAYNHQGMLFSRNGLIVSRSRTLCAGNEKRRLLIIELIHNLSLLTKRDYRRFLDDIASPRNKNCL